MSRNEESRASAGVIVRREVAFTFELPGEEVYPEGICLDERQGLFFVSGARSGKIYRGDPATGQVEEFVSGEDREPLTTIGLDVDRFGQLWVAGGASGKLFVFDAVTGELRRTLSTPPTDDTFINDLVSGESGDVYATDSLRPVLFRVPSGSDEVEWWLDLSGTAFESRAAGSDANGIVITPDEEYLIAVKTGTGQLFRIDTSDGTIREIDLYDEPVTGGDGLVLEGRRLYVVRSPEAVVDVLVLSPDLLSARHESRLIDPSFEFPTTAAKTGNDLLVVNSQFDVMGEGSPRLPFTVSRLRTG